MSTRTVAHLRRTDPAAPQHSDTLAIPLEVSPAALTAIADRTAALVLQQLSAAVGQSAARPWLTSKEAAEHLRCGEGRLRRLASTGRIPVHKEGGRNLYARAELDEWILSGAAECCP